MLNNHLRHSVFFSTCTLLLDVVYRKIAQNSQNAQAFIRKGLAFWKKTNTGKHSCVVTYVTNTPSTER